MFVLSVIAVWYQYGHAPAEPFINGIMETEEGTMDVVSQFQNWYYCWTNYFSFLCRSINFITSVKTSSNIISTIEILRSYGFNKLYRTNGNDFNCW